MKIKLPEKVNVLTLCLLMALIAPLMIKSNYVMHVLVLLGVWVILSESLNFVTGYAGQAALGHAAFVTIGAYIGSLLLMDYKIPYWSALLIGGVFSSLAGLILGILAIRLRGDYLGMVTMGFGEIVRIFAINLKDITRGPMGLPGIPRPVIFGYPFKGELPYYFLILTLVVITHIIIERMVFSRFGRACLAIRDDEIAASAMGIEVHKYKALSFCIACFFAGVVGVFYATWVTLFSPDSFTLTDSINLSVMITLGGIGSMFGAIPGAIVIGVLPELMRPFTTGSNVASLRLSFVGLLMIILMRVRPQGMFGMSLSQVYISKDTFKHVFFKKKK